MTAIRKTEAAFIVPVYDSKCDITDAWNEVLDPSSEFNTTVTAYFAHTVNTCGETIVDLIGIATDDGHGAQYSTYAQACDQMGADTVHRIESAHQSEVSEGHPNGWLG